MNTQKLFYKDKPLFGLDIGANSIKAMQVTHDGKHISVNGYGVIRFDTVATENGVITNFEPLAKAMLELFDKHINGKITTRRVAATIPASNAYSRVMSLPASLSRKELDEAVRFEAEQYIPIPIDELYIDYSTGTISEENREVLVVAVPKKIIDSYMRFFELVGLEVCAIETTISAASRLIAETDRTASTPSILIDLGSVSVDLSIYDKILVVNGTVPGGGDNFREQIKERLNVSNAEADTIKMKYGLGISKKQSEIRQALSGQLDSLTKEIRRVVRYYEERTEGRSKIGQIITMGGGANMPGLTDYLTDNLRLPTRMCSFWSTVELHKLQPPPEGERSIFVSVAGVALISPKGIWK
ncbi:type IV pilus assembly protein PilM [soil metagenome]